jgi:hypothetical protein
MRTALWTSFVMLAGVGGWFARAEVEPMEIAIPSPRPTIARAVTAPVEREQMIVIAPRYESSAGGNGRNLFAYVERSAPETIRDVAPPVVNAVLPPPLVAAPIPTIAAETPPPFRYRFIGSFGTRAVRIAAFVRDGEVVTARAGEHVGADFVLRSIGMESVEVECVRCSSATIQRVAGGAR